MTAVTSPLFIRFAAVQAGVETAHLDVATPNAGTSVYSADLTFTGVDGATTLQVTAFDASGPLATSSLSVTADLSPPLITTAWSGGAWTLRSGTLSVPATITDATSGLQSATMQVSLADGGTATLSGSTSGATTTFTAAGTLGSPGKAEQLPFTLTATDKVGNTATLPAASGRVLKLDDALPVITADSANTLYGSAVWHGAGSGLGAALTVKLTDVGSGISRLTGSAPSVRLGAANAAVAATGTLASGGTANDGVWTFGNVVLPSDPSIESASYPLFFNAADSAGNAATSTTLTIQLDNKPPVYDLAQLGVDTAATPYDETDAQGVGLFLGATQAPGAPKVKVVARIVEGFLSSATATLPDGVTKIAGACTPGVGDSSCAFLIARPALTGSYALTLDAVDLAGNKSARPGYALHFDNDPPAAYAAAISADATWYKRGPAVTCVVTATLTSLPATGVASVTLTPAGGTAIAPSTTSADQKTYTFTLPTNIAPVGAQGPFNITLAVTPVSGRVALSTGTRNIDGLAPVATITTPGWVGLANAASVPLPVAVSDGIGIGSGSGVASYSLLFRGATISGIPNQPFTLDALAGTPALFEGSYPLAVTATDVVGNSSSTASSLLVDLAPPALTSFDTTAVGTPGSWVAPDGKVWLKVNGAVTADVLAVIDPGKGSPLQGVSLYAGASACQAVAPSTDVASPFHFAVPRCLGAGKEGPISLLFNAADQAGNQLAAGPFATSGRAAFVYFDDVAPSAAVLVSPAAAQWVARSAGVGASTLPVNLTLTESGSGVATVALMPQGGSSVSATSTTNGWVANLSLASAPAGQAQALAVAVNAVDHVGNASSGLSVSLLVDDSAPVIGPDPAGTGLGSNTWYGGAGTLALPATVRITDSGAGVAGGGSAPTLRFGSSTAAVAASGTLTSGTAADGVWGFGAVLLPGDASIESSAYPVYVAATDLVGNASTSTAFTVRLDNKPPVFELGSVQVDTNTTPYNGVDAQGVGWFRSNTLLPGFKVALTARIAETNFATSSVTLPNGSVVQGQCGMPGAVTNCSYVIPRPDTGPNYTVTFDAIDLAGNHVAGAKPQLTLHFDGVSVSAYSPTVNADTSWYKRDPTKNITVTATVSTLPDSGFGAVTLAPTGGSPIFPATISADKLTYTFLLPTTAGRVAAEEALDSLLTFMAVIQSGAARTVRRFIDAVPPKITLTAPTGWIGGGTANFANLPVTVFDGPGSGVGSYNLQVGSATLPGNNDQPFNFDVTPYLPALFEGTLPFLVNATDVVGNATSTSGSLLVDLAPPKLTSFTVASSGAAGDYTDGNGTVWLRVTGAATADVTVVLDPLLGSPIQAVSLYAGAGACQAIAATADVVSPFRFKVPRCLGAGKEGAVTLLLNAVDQAGNQLVAGNLGTTGLPMNVYFDDQAPSSASLVSPTGWVSRTSGLGASTLTVVASVVDSGSGVLSTTMTPQGGTTTAATPVAQGWSAKLGLSSAPVGIAQNFNVAISATDHVGNPSTSIAPLVLRVDDAAPVISADPANVIYTATSWHGAQAGSLIVPLTARITDSGAGVGTSPAPTTQIGSSGATVINGTFKSGTSLDGIYDFGNQTLPSTASLETNAYPLYFNAADQVGNPAVTKVLTVQLDNKPPVYNSISVDIAATPFDGTDGALQGWFLGVTRAPAAPAIKVVAHITEGYFKSATVTPAGGATTLGACTGAGPVDCTFTVPRPALSGPYVLTFDATDLANNTVAGTKPTFTLYFDDDAPATYAPAIAADTAWYKRDPAVNLSVSVTLPKLPASGVSAVSLSPPAIGPPTVSADKKTYTFSLASTVAPALTEAPFGISATVNAVVPLTATGTGSRNIDGLAPAISVDTGNALYSGAWLGVTSSTSGVLVTAKLTDGGAGVSAVSAPTVKLGSSGAAVKANGSLSTGTAANGVWSFGTITFPITENSAYPIYVDAKDLVGNAAASTPFTVKLDTVPPTVGSISVVTAYDGTDSSSQGWFKGSTLASGNITVSAVVTETYLASSTVTPAGGSAVTGTCSGTSPTFTCSYAVPRSATSGPLALTFDALDLAGNAVVSKPTTTLYFDNSTAASYTSVVNADTSWYARADGSNITVTATLPTLPASGVSTVTLTPSGATATNPTTVSPDKKTYTFAMPTTSAPAATEAAFSFSVTVKSVVQQTASTGGSRNIDGLPPVITKDTGNALYNAGAWLGVSSSTTGVSVTAKLTDGGAGVSAVTGSAPTVKLGSSGAAVKATGSLSPGPAANGVWSFGTVIFPAATEDSAYPIFFDAKDLVGNAAASTPIPVQLDTKPPTMGSVAVVIAYDGTDSSSQGWFLGSTLTAGNILLSAMVTETNLASTTVTPASGSAVPGTCPGPGPTYTCTYSVPRSATSGATVFTFDALDFAGNAVVSKPTTTLYFDNSTVASYTPAINADTSWYARSAGTNITITATLPALPASGVSAVTLTPSGGTAINPSTVSPDKKTYAFAMPTTAAPASIEVALPFSVTVKSVVQQSASVGGTRNIDDLPPVVQNVSISYPASDTSTPLQFSHDGNRFNLREGTVSVLTFKGYDCGAGAATGSGQAAVSGIAASVAAPGADSGTTASCSNGNSPKVFTYALAFDPAAISRSALPNEDTSLPISLSLADGLGHVGSLSTSVTITRRLWQSASVGTTQLALGPKVFGLGSSKLVALDKAAGGFTTWDNTAGIEALAVGGDSSTPIVYWLANNTLKSSPANPAAPTVSSCNLVPGADVNPIDEGLIIRDSTSALATSDSTLETYGKIYDCSLCSGPALTNCTNTCATTSICGTCGLACGKVVGFDNANVCTSTARRTTTSLTGSTCAKVASAPVSTSAAIYSARLFSLNPSGAITETPVTGGTLSETNAINPPSPAMAVIQTAAGQQLFLSNGQRWDFSAGGVWSTAVQASGFGWPLSAGKGTDATGYTISRSAGKFVVQNTSGGTLGSLTTVGGTTSPMVDAAGTAFLTDRTALGQVEGLAFSSAGWGAAKMPSHTFPAVIDDLVLDVSGTLYVASGGVVYTLVTDSPGLGTDPGTGSNGLLWPTRGRDACRSQNLSFSCPW